MSGATEWIAEDQQAFRIQGANWRIADDTQPAEMPRSSVDRLRQAL